MTATYALFEDGSASRIVFDFFAPEPADEPMRLACVGIEDRQVVHSAQIGSLSAYHLLCRCGYLDPGERLFPSCQFGDAAANLRARGGSAGLAFCLKLALEVQRLKSADSAGGSVAATGVIENGSGEAAVGRVDRIDAKLRGAMAVLQRGDRVFVPAANEPDIAAEVREELSAKGLQLVPVATVEEALLCLLPRRGAPKAPGPRRLRVWQVVAVAALAGLAAWAWDRWQPREPTVAQVVAWCEQGDFGKAAEQLDEWLDEVQTEGGPAARVHRQLQEELGVEVEVHHLPAGSRGMQPVHIALRNGPLGLSADDLYRLSCTVSDSCYLYAFLLADDDARLLSAPFGADAPAALQPGRSYFLPGATENWYRMEAGQASSALCVVASRMRARDIERAWRQFDEAVEGDKADRRHELDRPLELRRGAQASGMGGVFYGELALHASAASADVR